MGDEIVGSFLLADTASSVQSFVSVFVGVYVLLIFAYIVMSWIPGGASPTLERVRQFLYDVCEPYLRLFRRFIPPARAARPVADRRGLLALRARPGRERRRGTASVNGGGMACR